MPDLSEVSFAVKEGGGPRKRTNLCTNKVGLIDTAGPFYGLPWWGPIFVSVVCQRLGHQLPPGKAAIIEPLLEEEHAVYNIHKSVTGIKVGRRADGSWLVEEQTPEDVDDE